MKRFMFFRWAQNIIHQSGFLVLLSMKLHFIITAVLTSTIFIIMISAIHIFSREINTDDLTGEIYLNFLWNDLNTLLQKLSEYARDRIQLQHDVVHAHYRQAVRIFLNEQFNNRRVGRGGSVPWSSELTKLDFQGEKVQAIFLFYRGKLTD